METEKASVLLTEEIRQLKIISQAKSETIEKMEKSNHRLKEQVGQLIKENLRLDRELDSFKFSSLVCAPDYESECKKLHGKVEAYEMCIKAFTGIGE